MSGWEVSQASGLWGKGIGTRVDATRWPSRDGQAPGTIRVRHFSFSDVVAYVRDLGGDC